MTNHNTFLARLVLLLAILGGTNSLAHAERGRPVIDDSLGFKRLLSDRGTLLRGVSLSWDGGDPYGSQKKFMPSQASLDALARDYGYNTVHLYLEGDSSGNTDPVGYNAADCDVLVDRCAEAGLYLIITIGCNGENGAIHSMDFIQDFWRFYGPRYKDRTHVIYEAKNEPVHFTAAHWRPEDWDDQVTMYRTIRKAAPETMVLLFSYMGFRYEGAVADAVEDGEKAAAGPTVGGAVSGERRAPGAPPDTAPAEAAGRRAEEVSAPEVGQLPGSPPARQAGRVSGGGTSSEGLKTAGGRDAEAAQRSPAELPSSSSFLPPAGGAGTAAAEWLTSPKRPRTEEKEAASPSAPPPRPSGADSRLRELEGTVELCRRLFLQNKFEQLGRVLEDAAAGAPTGAPRKFRVGETVLVGRTQKQLGTIRYSGPTAFGEGDWVGLELQSPVGRTDGSVNGVTYFKCAANQGIFVKASILVKAREQTRQAGAPVSAPGSPAPLPA